MRPEVAKYKSGLLQYTNLDWQFKDGQMISAPTSRTLLDRLFERENIPATLVPSNDPLKAQMTMTLENTEDFLERMARERGSEINP